MRPIKFRAWDKEKKEMREVTGINWYDEYMWVDETPMSGDKLPIEDTPLMQFTGVTNSEGQEIYEGDIVQANGQKCEVVYDESIASFMVKDFDWGHTFGGVKLLGAALNQVIDGPYGSGFVVIGNIYENPEFFKGKK